MRVTNFLPVSNNPPLDLNISKPLFATARTGLAFGFQYRGPVDQPVAHQLILKIDHQNGIQDDED